MQLFRYYPRPDRLLPCAGCQPIAIASDCLAGRATSPYFVLLLSGGGPRVMIELCSHIAMASNRHQKLATIAWRETPTTT